MLEISWLVLVWFSRLISLQPHYLACKRSENGHRITTHDSLTYQVRKSLSCLLVAERDIAYWLNSFAYWLNSFFFPCIPFSPLFTCFHGSIIMIVVVGHSLVVEYIFFSLVYLSLLCLPPFMVCTWMITCHFLYSALLDTNWCIYVSTIFWFHWLGWLPGLPSAKSRF